MPIFTYVTFAIAWFKQKTLNHLMEREFVLCAHLGSNQGPKDYESSTLTD